ncbi:MAG: TonB-dependent receptor, partial [Terriglobus roseus]|nr:TonB-dependent receptor [Terriglobus roseus]
NHHKHNLNVGFDARRVQNNVIGSTNVLGSFTFSGIYTQDPNASTSTRGSTTTNSGSSFADFLLGAPQQSAIQSGLNKIHLRETVVNAYGFDDWRALPNLSLNLGLRYEYFSPYYETNNQLVNLDHSADFTTVAPVLPDGTGPFGGKFPRSLVNPDRTMFSPRLGLAWRPKGNNRFARNTVVRAGYGINYNTTAFGSFANSLSYQVPFAVTQTNIASLPGSNDAGCGTFTAPGTVNHSTFTLTNAFNCTSKAVTNNFAINRNYRLGRVQVMNAGIQHTFGLGILVNVDYNGSLGANLDILRAPGATPTGLATTNGQAYTFEDSAANSRFSSVFVSARKRMSRGIALQATYTYGHGIDNASTLSGGGGTVAQNYQRLDLEYGNSNFDVRHRATGTWVFELPFGENRAFLNKGGWLSYALNGFNLSGDFTFATGTYATPQYQNTAAQLVTGGNYTLRPDRVFSEPIQGAGSLRSWFNTAAFTAPPSGAFGNSSRNSIELPGTVSEDMSLSRDFTFGDLKNLEVRATANNVFNTVQYSGVNTVLNSANFGQVSTVAPARRLSFQARYRF